MEEYFILMGHFVEECQEKLQSALRASVYHFHKLFCRHFKRKRRKCFLTIKHQVILFYLFHSHIQQIFSVTLLTLFFYSLIKGYGIIFKNKAEPH